MFTTFPEGTNIVYLDQNKWNDLSNAYHGLPQGQKFQHVLEKILMAVSNKSAIFPLSFEHYFETSKDPDAERRKRLAKVMAEVSQGVTISPQERTLQWELEGALAKLYDEPSPKTLSLFGYGFPCAIGVSLVTEDQTGNYVMKDHNGDFVTISIDQFEQIRERLFSSQAIYDFLMESDNGEFSAWTQEFQAHRINLTGRLENFRTKVRKSNKPLHKHAYIAHIATALEEEITKALDYFNKTPEEFFSIGAEKLDDFWEDVPTLNVEIELNVGRNEHWDRKIEPNDATDISFLNVALPYCDVLVVEKYFHNLIKQIGLDKRYQTLVFRDLNDLEGILV